MFKRTTNRTKTDSDNSHKLPLLSAHLQGAQYKFTIADKFISVAVKSCRSRANNKIYDSHLAMCKWRPSVCHEASATDQRFVSACQAPSLHRELRVGRLWPGGRTLHCQEPRRSRTYVPHFKMLNLVSSIIPESSSVLFCSTLNTHTNKHTQYIHGEPR